MAAVAAATVVFPTPPGPQTTTISLAARRASMVTGPSLRPVNSRAPQRGHPLSDEWNANRKNAGTNRVRTASSDDPDARAARPRAARKRSR